MLKKGALKMSKHPFDLFGKYLFSDAVMKERLPHPIYLRFKTSLKHETQLDQKTAEAIAHAMKTWAIDLGATHYSHWFQPMTGATAEKHDAFLEPGEDGLPLARFSGKSLIKGETDGSSFPNGGLRATFEARGYTYWDISSPAFIRDNVLCIPTVFVSFNGDTLDKKAPLLKSMDVLSKQACRVLHLLNDHDVKRVTPSLGLEQEYFLVDEKHFKARLDLLLTGRTLIGQFPPKGQDSEDHYFGSIPSRIKSFMEEVNLECWKLGIYSRVEHNEVAFNQFEIVPVFAATHIAVDQNQLMMDILKKTAKKHGLACLLHEKPFAGINGSGKHNNWSLMTDTGTNLYDPGDTPEENLRFLMFVVSLVKAVDQFPELLRMAASGPGNDHRLGANEAPPAIISVYLGAMLENLLNEIESGSTLTTNGNNLHSPLTTLKALPKELSDRNRTSPFAFTGTKFEFRMVGSSRSAASANTVLNTILADALLEMGDHLEKLLEEMDVKQAVYAVCTKVMQEHRRVLFSGDGYAEAWLHEAKRRGLPNIASFTESIDSLIEPKAVTLFEKHGVYHEHELVARAEILHEQFIRAIKFEAKTLIDMIRKQILPAAVLDLLPYQQVSTSAFANKMVKKLSDSIDCLDDAITVLEGLIDEGNLIANHREKGLYLHQIVRPQLNEVRKCADALEAIMNKSNYPIPTYSDILFNFD